MSEGARVIAVGRIGRAHGIKGDVNIHIYGDDASFISYPRLLLPDEHGKLHETGVTSARLKKPGKAVVHLEGISDRNMAEALSGRQVFVNGDWLPEPEADESYWYELEGLKVVTDRGEELGHITGIMQTPGHDIYVVSAPNGKEILVPAVKEFVTDIDPDSGICRVSLPPGLVTLNDN